MNKLQKIGFKKGHEAGFVEGDKHGFHRGLKKVVNSLLLTQLIRISGSLRTHDCSDAIVICVNLIKCYYIIGSDSKN